MTYNRTAQLRELYFQYSRYSVKETPAPSYDSLPQWSSNGYFDKLKPETINKAVRPVPERYRQAFPDIIPVQHSFKPSQLSKYKQLQKVDKTDRLREFGRQ
jgi:hypothetical protein